MFAIRLNRDYITNNIKSDKIVLLFWLIANARLHEANNGVLKFRTMLSIRSVSNEIGINRGNIHRAIKSLVKDEIIRFIKNPGREQSIIEFINCYESQDKNICDTKLNDSQLVIALCVTQNDLDEKKLGHKLGHKTNCESSSYIESCDANCDTNEILQKEKQEQKEKFPPHTPLYKEKKEKKEKSADTRMRVRERKDFFNSIFSDLMSRDGLVNQYCKNNSISKEVFLELARESIEQLDFIGNQYESEQDAKKHIISTINNKIRIRKQNEQRKRQNILRREFEPAPAASTNYDADF